MHEPSFLTQYSMFGGICVGVAFVFSIVAGLLYVLVATGHENLRQWARFAYVMVAQGVIWAAAHLMFLVWHHR
ncbi:MAG: hypothetical protein LC772_00830, partial [Chloroflexi bacterium]|nr:hypothetical protein [Chloroflexota bacterium]